MQKKKKKAYPKWKEEFALKITALVSANSSESVNKTSYSRAIYNSI